MKPKTKCIGARIFTETTQPKGKTYGERNVDVSQLRLLVRFALRCCDYEMDDATDDKSYKHAEKKKTNVDKLRKEWSL